MARLEVITGPMFSGKSTVLISKLERATYAERRVLVIKPKIDTRTVSRIASRKKKNKKDSTFEEHGSFPAHEVTSAQEFIQLVSQHQPDVLAIDEVQFFPEWIPQLINELLDVNENSDFVIIVSGLDMDAWKKPFGIIPQLMAMADEVDKLTAVCFKCKKPANLTYKYGGTLSQIIEVGDTEKYEARCRSCHKLPE